MPQIQPITIVSTPVGADVRRETVLEPLGNKDGVVTYSGGDYYIDQATGDTITEPPTAVALQTLMSVSLNRPSKTSRISKVRVKLTMPVAALDLAGLPTTTKSHELSADIVYIFPEKATEQERQDCVKLFAAALVGEPFRSVAENLKSMY